MRIYVPLDKSMTDEEVVRTIEEAVEAATAARIDEATSEVQEQDEVDGEGVEPSTEKLGDLD